MNQSAYPKRTPSQINKAWYLQHEDSNPYFRAPTAITKHEIRGQTPQLKQMNGVMLLASRAANRTKNFFTSDVPNKNENDYTSAMRSSSLNTIGGGCDYGAAQYNSRSTLH